MNSPVSDAYGPLFACDDCTFVDQIIARRLRSFFQGTWGSSAVFAQTDCGGPRAIRAIGKGRGQAASSYAGGVRILHGPSRRGVPTTKSESRCRGDGRS